MGMGVRGVRGGVWRTVAAVLAPAFAWAAVPEPVPTAMPSASVDAQSAFVCLSHELMEPNASALDSSVPLRRAAAGRRGASPSLEDQRVVLPDGLTVVFSVARGSPDRIDPADLDLDGVPDAVDAVAAGIEAARRVTIDDLGLPNPAPVGVVLGRVPGAYHGYALGDPSGSWTVVLDARPGTPAATLTRAAAHHFAHAALRGSGRAPSPEWLEAFAGWVELRAAGADGPLLERLRVRRDRLYDGLAPQDRTVVAGNSLWLAFLSEAIGPSAVRLGLEELASARGDDLQAWDRALRRAGGGLIDALREMQVWATLTGTRDDGRHWSFAGLLGDASFAARADGLPALSVRADPAISPAGLASALIRPEGTTGGLTVRFEGDFGGAWGADVLLSFRDGALHRVPIEIDTAGSGEVTVPLDRVAEAVLLVRNLATEGPPRRYTWSAFREPGFPVEFEDASTVAAPVGDAIAIAWTTLAERRVIGFDLWREPAGGGERVRVNPVRVPAIGAPGQPASYQFVDRGAAPGRGYVYAVEALTVEGLSSFSPPSPPVSAP